MSVAPAHNLNVPAVEGMQLLGHSEGYDVYFVPHAETAIHAITIVGAEEWDYDSCLIMMIRRSIARGDRRYSDGPWALGVSESDRLGLADNTNINSILAALA